MLSAEPQTVASRKSYPSSRPFHASGHRAAAAVVLSLAAAACHDAPVAPVGGALAGPAPFASVVESGGLPTTWYIHRDDGSFDAVQLGLETDVAVQADYDGDGKTDAAVFRPSTGFWYIQPASGAPMIEVKWGQEGDVPVPGDYDGDGKSDLAIFRPGTTTWWLHMSGSGAEVPMQFGLATDVLVPADYDGDGTTDLAIVRPATNQWWIRRSTTGQISPVTFGTTGDVPVPADYDGDGAAEVAVYRESTGQWWSLNLSTLALGVVAWGDPGDLLVPGDYDGDGRADRAVFRPSTAQWWVLQSSTPTPAVFTWGLSTDEPVPGRYAGGTQERAAVRRAGLIPQAIDFTMPPLRVLGNSYALAATGGGSGNPVVFASLTPATCTVSGSTATMVAIGACTITANQAGGGAFGAAPQVERTANVVFSFALASPLQAGAVNDVSSGGNLKVSFGLGGNHGLAILAGGSPTSVQVSCTEPHGALGAPAPTTAAGQALSYARNTGTYTYAWKTDKAWRGTCREFQLVLTDGLARGVIFRFR